MNKYTVYTTEKVYTTFFEVEAESESEAKFKVENGEATYRNKKDTDSEELIVESIELSK